MSDPPLEPEGTVDPPAVDPLVCASCAAPLDADQTYCLECGAPTPKAPRLSKGRGLGAVALGLAVLGLGTGGLAWAVASDRDSSGTASTGPLSTTIPTSTFTTIDTNGVPTTLPPVTSGTPSVPAVSDVTDTTFITTTSGTGTLPPPATETTVTTTGTTAGTTTDATTPTTAGTTTDATATPTTDATASDWPAGRTAWTAVLASARNRSEAATVRDRAERDGETAGILISGDHPELKPGFFVVFSGVFSSRQKAVDEAARLKSDFARAYARKLTG